MKGIVFLGYCRCEVREVSTPRPGHGEVLVRVKAAGICGSDLSVYRQENSTGQVRGHEASGTVEEVGPGVLRLTPGDRVSVHHHYGCGVCEQCSEGETVACTVQHQVLGVQVSGAFGEFVVAPERNCISLAPNSSFEDGAFMGCVGGTAYGALRRLGATPHESLAVFGLGPVGLSCVLVAKALGLRVIGSDPIPLRRELALKCGADHAVDPSAENALDLLRSFGSVPGVAGDGVDTVLETSGSAPARSSILPALRRKGRAAILGVGSTEKVINPSDIHGRAATLIGSVVFPLGWMWALSRLCASCQLTFSPAVTHRFSLDEAKEALQIADRAEGGKVLFISHD